LKSRKNRNIVVGDSWETPTDLYDELNKEFEFDFDPCPLDHDLNLWNGLDIEWGKSNYVNPPYSRKLKEAFVKKAIKEFKKNKTIVMLLPVSTSTKLFHDYILPNKTEIRFVKGRLAFRGQNQYGETIDSVRAMFDNMIIIFKNE